MVLCPGYRMTLREKFEQAEYTSAGNMLGENLEQAIVRGLQDIFSDTGSNRLPEKPKVPSLLSPIKSTGIFDPNQGKKKYWP